ncbi:hypothetical protein EZV62_000491 [Acer yangbiense]|uniref:Uncharacterized protein n=1 Tax=Acer yangbiense TaxID=1000413 RepID=A0A5C7IU08_9ROSI|nr:hypothetical protein EZV62_000491 [Acer yangbiense]
MEPIAAGSASDPKAPAHTTQLMLQIDESASSSQGPQNQNNAPIYNWPILDLLPMFNLQSYTYTELKMTNTAVKVFPDCDWEKAKHLIEEDPSMVRTAITWKYETALHVATKAEQTVFVLEIIKHMNERTRLDAARYRKGDTAFCLAVAKVLGICGRSTWLFCLEKSIWQSFYIITLLI